MLLLLALCLHFDVPMGGSTSLSATHDYLTVSSELNLVKRFSTRLLLLSSYTILQNLCLPPWVTMMRSFQFTNTHLVKSLADSLTRSTLSIRRFQPRPLPVMMLDPKPTQSYSSRRMREKTLSVCFRIPKILTRAWQPRRPSLNQ
jgi:hypothetical protein